MIYLICLMIALGGGDNLFAQTKAVDAEQQQSLQKTLRYLNDLRQFSVVFTQWDQWGGMRSGTLYVSRPGRLRAVYDAPFEDVIIIERGEVFFHDDEAASHYRFGSSVIPLTALLKDRITLSGDYRIDSFLREAGLMVWVMESSDGSVAGSLTLVLQESPMRLVRWLLEDERGSITRIELGDIKEMSQFEEGFFSILKHIPDRRPFGAP